MTTNMNASNWSAIALSKPAIFINGGHHSRELSTVSMNVYTILKVLFNYVQNDTNTLNLMQYTTMLVMPIINYDGYVAIANYY